MLRDGNSALHDESIVALLNRITRIDRCMHVEKLEEINGKPGFTKAQGED